LRDERYYVIPNFFSLEDSEEMLNQAKKLIEEMDLSDHPMASHLVVVRPQLNAHATLFLVDHLLHL
jgi:hypothetical protein